jgi:hypothetical protein
MPDLRKDPIERLTLAMAFASIVLAISESATATEELSLDVRSCKPIRSVRFLPLGSQTFEIVGQRDAYCLLKFGAEIEKSQAAKALPIECKVPKSVGVIQIAADETEDPLRTFKQYCVDTMTGAPIND